MTNEELLNDLDERIDRGITTLESMACDVDCAPQMHSLNESLRLRAKAEGLCLVRDWLRFYRTPENVETSTMTNRQGDAT